MNTFIKRAKSKSIMDNSLSQDGASTSKRKPSFIAKQESTCPCTCPYENITRIVSERIHNHKLSSNNDVSSDASETSLDFDEVLLYSSIIPESSKQCCKQGSRSVSTQTLNSRRSMSRLLLSVIRKWKQVVREEENERKRRSKKMKEKLEETSKMGEVKEKKKLEEKEETIMEVIEEIPKLQEKEEEEEEAEEEEKQRKKEEEEEEEVEEERTNGKRKKETELKEKKEESGEKEIIIPKESERNLSEDLSQQPANLPFVRANWSETRIVGDDDADLKLLSNIPVILRRGTNPFSFPLPRAKEIREDELKLNFRRGFRPDNVNLDEKVAFLSTPLVTVTAEDVDLKEESNMEQRRPVVFLSENEEPIDFVISLGFDVDESALQLREVEAKHRLQAALVEAKIWVKYVTVAQGTLMLFLCQHATLVVMRSFLQMVEAIVNNRITSANQIDAYFRLLNKIDIGTIQQMRHFGSTKRAEKEETEARKKQMITRFFQLYRTANEASRSKKGTPISKKQKKLLEYLCVKYRPAIRNNVNLLARFIGLGKLINFVQIDAAILFCARDETMEVDIPALETFCGIQVEKYAVGPTSDDEWWERTRKGPNEGDSSRETTKSSGDARKRWRSVQSISSFIRSRSTLHSTHSSSESRYSDIDDKKLLEVPLLKTHGHQRSKSGNARNDDGQTLNDNDGSRNRVVKPNNVAEDSFSDASSQGAVTAPHSSSGKEHEDKFKKFDETFHTYIAEEMLRQHSMPHDNLIGEYNRSVTTHREDTSKLKSDIGPSSSEVENPNISTVTPRREETPRGIFGEHISKNKTEVVKPSRDSEENFKDTSSQRAFADHDLRFCKDHKHIFRRTGIMIPTGIAEEMFRRRYMSHSHLIGVKTHDKEDTSKLKSYRGPSSSEAEKPNISAVTPTRKEELDNDFGESIIKDGTKGMKPSNDAEESFKDTSPEGALVAPHGRSRKKHKHKFQRRMLPADIAEKILRQRYMSHQQLIGKYSSRVTTHRDGASILKSGTGSSSIETGTPNTSSDDKCVMNIPHNSDIAKPRNDAENRFGDIMPLNEDMLHTRGGKKIHKKSYHGDVFPPHSNRVIRPSGDRKPRRQHTTNHRSSFGKDDRSAMAQGKDIEQLNSGTISPNEVELSSINYTSLICEAEKSSNNVGKNGERKNSPITRIMSLFRHSGPGSIFSITRTSSRSQSQSNAKGNPINEVISQSSNVSNPRGGVERRSSGPLSQTDEAVFQRIAHWEHGRHELYEGETVPHSHSTEKPVSDEAPHRQHSTPRRGGLGKKGNSATTPRKNSEKLSRISRNSDVEKLNTCAIPPSSNEGHPCGNLRESIRESNSCNFIHNIPVFKSYTRGRSTVHTGSNSKSQSNRDGKLVSEVNLRRNNAAKPNSSTEKRSNDSLPQNEDTTPQKQRQES